ncbi:hypothetical protein B0A55_03185 [Friedmanniomyces simplex]|uniref:DUF7598 domain-containing protein n=1 Tax=Friedmanniomyces simplex TaxID=329884 RepID=A0A4U0XJJ9_9PEZI|nr:hypothetical protein B0A55_03185 [Friedmanniomyces simplex]
MNFVPATLFTPRLIYLPFEAHYINAATSKIQHFSSTASKKTHKMTLSPKSLAGPGYIILNGIRAMNIIGLLAVVTASVVMLVKTSLESNFFFFDAVSHVLTAITGMFLLVSELSLFRPYFARNWPLLSPSHGFVALALAMIVLGINMLGNLNKSPTSQKSLGLAFWRIVIGSGIVIFILGFVNLIASYIFRDRSKGVTARQVRAHGAVAVHQTPMPGTRTPPAPELAQSYIPNPITPSKSNNPFQFFTSERRQSILPSYHSHSPISSPVKDPISPSSKYSRATDCTKKNVFSFIGRNRQSVGPKLPVNVQKREMEISAPLGVNPQFAHLVQRPDSAMHPSRTGEREAFRWRAAS